MNPVTRLLADTPEAALLSTNREDKSAAAVPPTLSKGVEDTAVGVNILLHQLDEDVSAAFLHPLG